MVEYIEYKGKKLPVRLAYRAIKALKASKELDLASLEKGEFDMEIIEDLLWAGLQTGHKDEDKPLEFKKEDMADILDSVTPSGQACWLEFMKLIPKFFPKPEKVEETEKGNESAESSTEEK